MWCRPGAYWSNNCLKSCIMIDIKMSIEANYRGKTKSLPKKKTKKMLLSEIALTGWCVNQSFNLSKILVPQCFLCFSKMQRFLQSFLIFKLANFGALSSFQHKNLTIGCLFLKNNYFPPSPSPSLSCIISIMINSTKTNL